MDDDLVLSFQLESSALRGRLVRMGEALDRILGAHAYPDKINRPLAETVTLCAMLSSMLKYEGVFTLQVQGDGPIAMLVSDITSEGVIRGCATFNAERLEAADDTLSGLYGEGYIAFTVDQGPDTERYQGIVELKGANLVDSVQHYFTQSEQIETGIVMAAARGEDGWRSQGLMLQRMPEEGGHPVGSAEEDDWRRAMILMLSCKDEELLDPRLKAEDILTRLFHEEGVRVFPPKTIRKGCRCSEQKVEDIVRMMGPEDRKDMTVDGKITVTCEFCGRDYVLYPDRSGPKNDKVDDDK